MGVVVQFPRRVRAPKLNAQRSKDIPHDLAKRLADIDPHILMKRLAGIEPRKRAKK
jgi:hypothetical protein